MKTMTATFNANPFCTTTTSDCAAGSTYTLKLVNAKNPAYINSPVTNSVEIYTQNSILSSWLVVDQLATGIIFTSSALTPGPLTSPALTRTGSALTGAVPIYTFTFGTVTNLPQNAVIIVSFPINTAYIGTSSISCTRSSSSIPCTSAVSTSDTTMIASVTITSACTASAGCTPPVSFSIIVNNMNNPFST